MTGPEYGCDRCGVTVPDGAVCWYMATPVCGDCFLSGMPPVCADCGEPTGPDPEPIDTDTVLCRQCFDSQCDAHENATEARYYREK